MLFRLQPRLGSTGWSPWWVGPRTHTLLDTEQHRYMPRRKSCPLVQMVCIRRPQAPRSLRSHRYFHTDRIGERIAAHTRTSDRVLRRSLARMTTLAGNFLGKSRCILFRRLSECINHYRSQSCLHTAMRSHLVPARRYRVLGHLTRWTVHLQRHQSLARSHRLSSCQRHTREIQAALRCRHRNSHETSQEPQCRVECVRQCGPSYKMAE